MSNDINKLMKERPEAFDYPDSLPGSSGYTPEDAEAMTPPHIRALLAERQGDKPPAKPSEDQ